MKKRRFMILNLGNVPLIRESGGNVNLNCTELVEGHSTGKIQIFIENSPTSLIDIKDSESNVFHILFYYYRNK